MNNFLKKTIIIIALSYFLVINHHDSLAAAESPSMSIEKAKPDIELATDPPALTQNIVTLIFVIGVGLAFFFLIAGAIAWITSGGDKGKVEEARSKVYAAVIGLFILAATWAIFVLVTDIGFGGHDQLAIPKLNEAGS